MSELEKRVRELTLREPGDTLDQRVLSCFQSSGNVAARESVFGRHEAEVNAPLKNALTRIRRRVISGTISGFVAALLVGMAIGNGLPSVWSRFGHSPAGRSSSIPADGTVVSTYDEDASADSEFSHRHRMTPDLSQHLRDELQKRKSAGSQFVESHYLSAIAGASLWERQNGEKFDVTTHVSDRRFDMCRDCHRVGG